MREYFAGANTPEGFVSFFENVYTKEEHDKIYLIKGGSGVGKSTALKKIARFFDEKGYEVEKILCSSDPESLDGVNIPKLKITFFDATAPHAMEATMPIVLEEIVDFANFLNRENLLKEKESILKILKIKKAGYATCYRYLKSAKILMDLNEEIYKSHTNYQLISKHSKKICDEFFEPAKNRVIKNRYLFSEAFNLNGYTDITNSLLSDLNVYSTKGINDYTNGVFMAELLKLINERGYNAEVFLSTFNTDIIKTIIVKDKGIAFTSAAPPQSKKIATRGWLKKMSLEEKEATEKNNEIIKSLHELAREALIKTSRQHAVIEGIYSENMDFKALDVFIEELLNSYELGVQL